MDGEHILVIGGGGFLGQSIVNLLLNLSMSKSATPSFLVSIFDYRNTFEDDRLHTYVTGDITNASDILETCNKHGITIVIHTASPHQTAAPDLHQLVNVTGTENVISACIASPTVKKLVYTSSASVIFSGTDLINADETYPYASTHIDTYTETKAIAEQKVLEANGKNGLLTIALRPSGIFGPRDMQGAYTLVKGARRGQWRMIIGSNETLFDMTYVENVAFAHMLAATRLAADNGTAGQAFFITNDQPIFFWDYPKQFFQHMGYQNTQQVCIPRFVALYIGILMDIISFVVRIVSNTVYGSPDRIRFDPVLTAFRVRMLTVNRYFNVSKAKKLLGYEPIVSMEEGIRRTGEYWKAYEALQQDKQ